MPSFAKRLLQRISVIRFKVHKGRRDLTHTASHLEVVFWSIPINCRSYWRMGDGVFVTILHMLLPDLHNPVMYCLFLLVPWSLFNMTPSWGGQIGEVM